MPADSNATIVRFVDEVLSAMGLSLQITTSESSDALHLELAGDGAELLLRRRGEALDALQHLVNTAFRSQARESKRIAIDCMQFRKAKDAELRQMASFLMEKAKSTGVPQEIGPLNSYARRIVHLAVAEDPALASESVGDAAMKTVIISRRS
jgi:spoIIIJ-associated protein